MAAQQRKAAPTPASEGVNFLSLDIYTSGGSLPEGDYWWEDASLVLHTGFNPANPSPLRLGVMLKLHDLSDLKAEPKKQFYSLGGKAHLSFAPDPTGKRLVPIPGGPAFQFNDQTNFAVLLKSLIDSDPTIQTLATNDLSVFDGLHAHMQSVPEPEGRKAFGAGAATTGEAAANKDERKSLTIGVVTHILDNGKPWEGTGGKPKGVTVTSKVNGAPAPATQAAPAAAADDDLETAVLNGLGTFIENNPSGGSKLVVRTTTLKYISEKYGEDAKSAVEAAYFGNDSALNAVLGKHGYTLSGMMIKPI